MPALQGPFSGWAKSLPGGVYRGGRGNKQTVTVPARPEGAPMMSAGCSRSPRRTPGRKPEPPRRPPPARTAAAQRKAGGGGRAAAPPGTAVVRVRLPARAPGRIPALNSAPPAASALPAPEKHRARPPPLAPARSRRYGGLEGGCSYRGAGAGRSR